MLGTKPQWSVERQGPDGSPALMRAPTAVTSARAARRAEPKRSQRRPGRRPERALITVEIRHAGIAAQHVGQVFGRVNLVMVEATPCSSRSPRRAGLPPGAR